jgi:hypothetical protein
VSENVEKCFESDIYICSGKFLYCSDTKNKVICNNGVLPDKLGLSPNKEFAYVQCI